MNTARYTPGPWHWHDDTLTTSDGTPVLMGGTYLRDHRVVAVSIDVRDADASLIAAAPDLLEALKEARHWLTEAADWNGTDYVHYPFSKTIDAAIAKAEGAQQ